MASFHTLRNEQRGARQRLLEADPWDLVIVDEAHHLNADERMGDTLAYGLLADLNRRKKTESLLFFTGTPHRGKDYGFFKLMQLSVRTSSIQSARVCLSFRSSGRR